MSLEHLIVGEETHLDHRKQDVDGAKNGRCWCDARDLLREIDGIDGRVQQGDSVLPLLWSLGRGGHGRNSR